MGRQFQLSVTLMNSDIVGHIVAWEFLYDTRLQERAHAMNTELIIQIY
jgi:hypothetical protein